MWRRLLRGGAALLAGIAGACDQGPATQPLGPRSAATWSSMIYAGADGPVWVDVYGDPFGLDKARLGETVAAALEGAVVVDRPFAFTGRREAAPRPEFRTVLVFAPARITDANGACAGTLQPHFPAPPEVVHLLAVFCREATPLAAVTGWAKGVSAPQDRRFDDLVRQAARELFRPELPHG